MPHAASGSEAPGTGRFLGGSLGTYAESSPLLIYKDFFPPIQAGHESQKSKPKGEKWNADAALIERYALQVQARKAMFEAFYRIPKEDRPKHPHRVVDCRRSLRPVKGEKGKLLMPAIFKHKATGSTFYAGLQICASGRACPHCAVKIGEKRAGEIRQAVRQWVASGGVCLFVTLTFPHYRKDTLSELVDAFQGSLMRFRKGASFDRIKASIGYQGMIRAAETTWGEVNGWHPHSHEIWFIRPCEGFDLEELRFRLFDRWKSAVVASGLSAPSFERGLVIQIAETEEQARARLAEYMAKSGLEQDVSAPVWGVDDELVKAHSKRGKPGRFTPFDFLREQYNPEQTKDKKAIYRRLFAEFVEEFKGVAQVFWSRGLKARFDLSEVSDEKHAEEGTEPAFFLLDVLPGAWAFAFGIPEKDFRARLLLEAKEKGAEGARAFLLSLVDLYYLEYFQKDWKGLDCDARYYLALPDSAFISVRENNHDSVL